MTLAIWPTNIPPFLRDPFERTAMDGRRQRAGEGLPRYERRFSQTAKSVSLAVEATLDERALFFRFFEDDLKGGSELFLMPDPTLDGARIASDALAVLTDENGTPLSVRADWLCLFADDMPSESITGGRFLISFGVWVMP